ncbi:MAG: 4Fe-4S dicluster domain-containing protein [Candidatus Lokiarchaeota archaeon]|nr:4Fe-4S dicluster domain-containing protein [Candidatus Lokiarchaeota archaeon]MBD3199664.1 4Fe-4S dicluster domain-containing protein [Candidatus Lokiarchaeota archaeon]
MDVINISEIYDELRSHLDKLPSGYPKTDSKVEIEILKELFTPEEAYIASRLSFFPQKIKQLIRKLDNNTLEMDDLERTLNRMLEKGLIMISDNNGERMYSNLMFLVGIYEYQLGRLNPTLVSNILQYFEEAFFEREFNSTSIPQLRTIPVDKAIPPHLSIATYDQLNSFIENASTIGIMDCICRVAHDIINDPCKKTDLRETCMTFGTAAKKYKEKGLARIISKSEAYVLADKFEEEGLVVSPSNSQKPFVVCNCCGCCCEIISNQKKFENPSQYFATNYYALVDEEICTGCSVCVDSCNIEAIQICDNKSRINLGKCIGCGICITKCPENAIKLEKKDKELIPPINTLETYMKMMNEKNRVKNES